MCLSKHFATSTLPPPGVLPVLMLTDDRPKSPTGKHFAFFPGTPYSSPERRSCDFPEDTVTFRRRLWICLYRTAYILQIYFRSTLYRRAYIFWISHPISSGVHRRPESVIPSLVWPPRDLAFQTCGYHSESDRFPSRKTRRIVMIDVFRQIIIQNYTTGVEGMQENVYG